MFNKLIVAILKNEDLPKGLKSTVAAQCAFVSNFGKDDLAIKHNNYCGLSWREELDAFADKVNYNGNEMCGFENEEAFVKGYVAFINRAHYQGWKAFSEDGDGFLNFLVSKSFSSDLEYFSKIIDLKDEVNALILAENNQDDDEDSPGRFSLDDDGDGLIDMPEFQTQLGVNSKFRGKRPNGLEGLIFHYDASRLYPGTKETFDDYGAKSVLKNSFAQGYAFITIGRSGKIYLPENHEWLSFGSHAGKSSCPLTNRIDVSTYYVGVEVNCYGNVYPTDDPNKFVPYFNAVSKKIVVNGKEQSIPIIKDGKATIASSKGVILGPDEVITYKEKLGNIFPGSYHKYTNEQVEAVISLCLYLKAKFPRTFRLDQVFGHDEVACEYDANQRPILRDGKVKRGRKVDPGGSLNYIYKEDNKPDIQVRTMAQFRALLTKLSGEKRLANS